MAKQSAGLLMYRQRNGRIEVLLIHPGGPYWRNKDLGAWSIPKGQYPPQEDPLDAAQREFHEETGFKAALAPEGQFLVLTPVKQGSGKVVRAWAFEGDCDANAIKSNEFEQEWPPGSGRKQMFPEVDRAAWFELSEAKRRILKAQAPLLEELEELLTTSGPTPACDTTNPNASGAG